MSNTVENDIRFLLDENLSPNIVSRLWEAGINALHVRDRARLRMSDYAILQLAESESRAVATINEHDFEKLVMKKQTHFGIAVIPSGGSRNDQCEYLVGIAKHLQTFPDAMAPSKIALFRSMKK